MASSRLIGHEVGSPESAAVKWTARVSQILGAQGSEKQEKQLEQLTQECVQAPRMQIFQVEKTGVQSIPPSDVEQRFYRQMQEKLTQLHPNRCAYPDCGMQENLSKCSRCRAVMYCGRPHQRAHWPQHKMLCKQIAQGS
jgi:hypothetical protein